MSAYSVGVHVSYDGRFSGVRAGTIQRLGAGRVGVCHVCVFAFLDGIFQSLPYLRTPDARASGNHDRGRCRIPNELEHGRFVQLPVRICTTIMGLGVLLLIERSKFGEELAAMAF